METSKKQSSVDDTHLSSSWEIRDRKMNKREFTNVKKLQDAFPPFLLLQGWVETQEYKKKKKSPRGMARCACTSFFPWKLIWGTRGFTWELLFLQIFLTFLNQRWTTSTDLSQTTFQLLYKRKQKISQKKRQKLSIKHFLNVLKAWLPLDHGLRPVLQ